MTGARASVVVGINLQRMEKRAPHQKNSGYSARQKRQHPLLVKPTPAEEAPGLTMAVHLSTESPTPSGFPGLPSISRAHHPSAALEHQSTGRVASRNALRAGASYTVLATVKLTHAHTVQALSIWKNALRTWQKPGYISAIMLASSSVLSLSSSCGSKGLCKRLGSIHLPGPGA